MKEQVIPGIDQRTEVALRCAFRVSNSLGHGFLEKVYENALAIELRHAGIAVIQQPSIEVRYRESVVGVYVPDLLLDDQVVVEVKAVRALDEMHCAQCINYLRATNTSVGLILNFGRPRIEYRRVVWKYQGESSADKRG